MTTLPLLFAVALFQDPVPAAASTAGRLDRVELQSGEVLEGRIVLERGGYLEIELGPGAVVGFRTTMVAAIVHGGGAARPIAAPPVLPAGDAWFTLHDGSGRPIGWLHGSTSPQDDGGVQLQEEWEFQQAGRQYQVTVIEVADRELRPQSCYFRERIREQVAGVSPLDPMATTWRTQKERIVEARVDGGELLVARLSADGRRERRLPWPADAAFPLLARARHGSTAAARISVPVFDAATEELGHHEFSAARSRQVPFGTGVVRVDEVVEQANGGDNAVWRDASARVLRREVAGPALVAVAADADCARAAADSPTLPSPFVADATRRFGLWRPNPVWVTAPSDTGAVLLRSRAHGAEICLSMLAAVEPSTPLDVAADAVERQVLLTHPGTTVTARTSARIRDRRAVCIECTNAAAGTRSTLHVVPTEDAFVVLCVVAPAAVWDELAPDFAAAAARLELAPTVVAALLPQDAGTAGSPTAVPTAERAADPVVPAAPAVPQPPVRVRVPAGQPLLPEPVSTPPAAPTGGK